MDIKLLQRLKVWRATQARKENVELFRILPNSTLEEIARKKPVTPEEFFQIKGIKEGRWGKYGSMLLGMVRDTVETGQVESRLSSRASSASSPASIFEEQDVVNSLLEEKKEVSSIPSERTLYTVSSFLDAFNVMFSAMTVRVRGEVSSVDNRNRVVYFSLKDTEDESVVNCLVFQYVYQVSGVSLSVGQAVIVEGIPEIYKPNGRFSLKVQSIELGGEGALQKAYDDLKKKLEGEGLFAPSRKRSLPRFPERIALITSRQGAAIGDFMMNLGKYGFKISLLDTSVEGKRAVFELIRAIKFFNRHKERYDILVIIRGGGSLESLQAFNNETLVREIARSTIPVLAGIGHEKDVSLAAMAADVMVSTPTATARTLRESWEEASLFLLKYERALMASYENILHRSARTIKTSSYFLSEKMMELRHRFALASHALIRQVEALHFTFQKKKEEIDQLKTVFARQYSLWIEVTGNRLRTLEETLNTNDPKRLLRLGYSLVTHQGKLLRSSKEVKPGDEVRIQLSEGKLISKVISS